MRNAILHMIGCTALRAVVDNSILARAYVRTLADEVDPNTPIADCCKRWLGDDTTYHHAFIDDLEEAVNDWEADITQCCLCRSDVGQVLETGFHKLCHRRLMANQRVQPLLTECANCQGTGKAQDDGPCGLCAGDGALT